MKKTFMFGIAAFMVLIFSASEGFAQFNSPYLWNNNALVNRALIYAKTSGAKSKRKSGKKAVAKTGKSRKKVIHRRSRRVSVLENMVEPTYIIVSDSPKRTEIA